MWSLVSLFDHDHEDEIDFAEVKGQESVKRALEIAAAGGHNVLLLFETIQLLEFESQCA
jgi:predicted ATPase with chaperone activity